MSHVTLLVSSGKFMGGLDFSGGRFFSVRGALFLFQGGTFLSLKRAQLNSGRLKPPGMKNAQYDFETNDVLMGE